MTSHIIRPLIDEESQTRTYIVTDRDSRKAVIIDPVLENTERDTTLLNEMGVSLTHILETHIHADHITGASYIKDKLGAPILYGAHNDVDGADRLLDEGDEVRFGNTVISTIFTPGHTNGCVSYLMGDSVFTGDAVLVRGCGRTDFQEGSADTLFDSVRNKIFTLPDETMVYPAHDYKGMIFSTVGEEKKYNPRLKLENTRAEFKGIMDNLNLPYPKKIDFAVPANRKAGRVDNRT